jgi:hypothetical protein
MHHAIVYADPGMYAGWPANHGAWQWGDEFLVGFLRGPFKRKSIHDIGEPFELMQARSRDGGRSWQAEPAAIPVDTAGMPTTPWCIEDSIIRVRGSYDHGGDFVDPPGCFYASEDRGRSWHGPHGFVGLEDLFGEPMLNTSRTRVLGDLLFMSRADGRAWGSDETLCVQHCGGQFRPIGTVCADRARAVMPAAAELDGRLVVVCRRRNTNRRGGWIEAFKSDDAGHGTWRSLGEVGETGCRNGNPPALVALPGGALLCTYANRSDRRLMGAISVDRGERWQQFVIREGGDDDIGYPQLFLRSDGMPVCVYYWADAERPQQHIAATVVEVPQ